MKNLRTTIFSLLALGLIFFIFSSLSNEPENKNIDVVILKLMGKELESAYIINDGYEKKIRDGLTGDEALEFYLLEGYKVEGTSVASDAGRFSIVYTLVKNQ